MTIHVLAVSAADEAGDFADLSVPRKRFSAADARAAAEFGTAELLIGEDATRDNVLRAVDRVQAQTRGEDTVLVYFAGHGRGGLVCHDTPAAADLANVKALPGPGGEAGPGDDGTLAVAHMLDPLLLSHAGPLLLLLDAGDESEGGRGLDLDALAAIEGQGPVAWLAASGPGQLSHESILLKRGVWSKHVLDALASGGVTAEAAAKRAADEVPRTLRTESDAVKHQTPRSGGPLAEITLSGAAAQAAPDADEPPARRLEGLTLTTQKRVRVKELSGFKKGWTVPDAASDYWQQKAADWAKGELEADLDETFAALKSAFRFKRKDLDKRGPDGGFGTLVCPGFDYNVSSELDADDPARMVLRREVAKISDPSLVVSDAFEEVFAGRFEAVRVRVEGGVDVEAVIDAVEDRDDESITLDYDPECTYCRVRFEGRSATALITPDDMTVTDPDAGTVRGLLESAADVRRTLAGALKS